MNARSIFVLATTVALLGALVDEASAQRSRPSSTISPTVASHISTTTAIASAMPDLTCVIAAYEDQAKTKPILNGAHLLYGGGAPSAWIDAKVKNSGGGGAPNAFVISLTTNVNGGLKTTTQTVPNLNAGLWQPIAPFQIPFQGTSNEIKVQVAADTGGANAESNEGNNSCSIAFKADVVH